MSKYFISYYTENPSELSCRCAIASLSGKGLDLFKRESGIGGIPGFTLDCITDIPLGTVEERYRHDELLRKFDKERDNSSVLEWLTFSDHGSAKKPSGDSEHIGTMVKLQKLAENIKTATNKANNENSSKTQPDKLSDIDVRNKFIYETAQDKKLSWDEVSEKMCKHFKSMFQKEGRMKFSTVLNAKATAQAARDYRKKYGLKPLPKREPGRKPGSTPKQQDK